MEENNVTISNSQNTGTIIGVQNNYNFSQKKIPTILSKIIKGISDISSEMDDIDTNDYTPYFPEEKIEYNNVVRYKTIICEYSKFYDICDKTLNILDNNEVGTRKKILREIHLEYELVLASLMDTSSKSRIDIVRENADNIIEEMIEILSNKINDTNNTENLSQEDIKIGIVVIICFAFIDCKILDKPKKEEVYVN